MEDSLYMVMLLGFILGMKHALEPDHIIALSTIASRSKSLWRSSLTGVFWGIGHTSTLFVIGLLLILLKLELSLRLSLSLEFLVGIMLVYLGFSTVISFQRKKIHNHEHQHDGIPHHHFHEKHEHSHSSFSYIKSTMIGMIHGLAGSAAMVLLVMSTVSSVWKGIVYILVFGLGTVSSMLIFTTIIGLPFVLSVKKRNLNTKLILATGALSALFGFYYMYNLGINEGLFKLWFS
ncbi:sulfite exporter TauE/SafE family protein [Paenibacillus sp. EPM92]|uniref:urease accessory protein UreH domain-containing protein n=1 Tax=Paenibacillus sp. EPM92 TaxID=1561195 RepID=UPI0019157807|nr:sulfite exporter TauE/SafE family protein [Paenibacillus sp. EPM92]